MLCRPASKAVLVNGDVLCLYFIKDEQNWRAFFRHGPMNQDGEYYRYLDISDKTFDYKFKTTSRSMEYLLKSRECLMEVVTSARLGIVNLIISTPHEYAIFKYLIKYGVNVITEERRTINE